MSAPIDGLTGDFARAYGPNHAVIKGNQKREPEPEPFKLGNGMPAGGNGLSAGSGGPLDVGLTGDFARAYGPNHAAIKGNQKREPEPEPFNFGSLIKDGEQILGSVLKREPEPFNFGSLIKDGEQILGSVLKREPVPEPEPFNFGSLIKDGEQILGSVL